MNDAPRRTLRELVARHGPGLCADARRCEGLLRDLCGAHRREINILIGALKERVPLDMLAARGSVPRGLLLARLAKRLEDHLALTGDAARWAVDSWALALGVVTDAEIEDREGASLQAAAPPTPAAAARPADEEAAAEKPPAGPPPATAPAPRSRPQRSGPPAPPPRPPANRPSAQPSAAPPPPAGLPTIPVGGRPAGPRPNAPAPTRTPPASPQARTRDTTARRGGGARRGCLAGCFLLFLLSVSLFVGFYFVLPILREGQEVVTPPARPQ
jgi:hypothetical protein